MLNDGEAPKSGLRPSMIGAFSRPSARPAGPSTTTKPHCAPSPRHPRSDATPTPQHPACRLILWGTYSNTHAAHRAHVGKHTHGTTDTACTTTRIHAQLTNHKHSSHHSDQPCGTTHLLNRARMRTATRHVAWHAMSAQPSSRVV